MESGGIGYDNPHMKYEMQHHEQVSPAMVQMTPAMAHMPPAMAHHMPPNAIQMPRNQMGIVQEKKSWSWCSTITASISLCFCSLFGFIGILFAVLSYSDHKVQDYRRAEHKRKCAMGWSISAIVIGIISIIIIIAAMAVLIWNKPASLEDRFYDYINGS